MNRLVLQDVLGALSAAFRAKDADRLLGLFSSTATATYAGSESGEKASGPHELRRLFTNLFDRPVAYSFRFDDITFGQGHATVWMLADGYCTEISDDGGTVGFPYRLAGVLAREGEQWRWEMLACSEPTPSAAPS